MPSEGIPVNKKIITWARHRAGFSLADAAAKFSHIEDWEAVGGGYPSYPQLERMADEFKVPIAVLFFPAPPEMYRQSENPFARYPTQNSISFLGVSYFCCAKRRRSSSISPSCFSVKILPHTG
jgi:transcriptional regulator with XRE-family HTH domain